MLAGWCQSMTFPYRNILWSLFNEQKRSIAWAGGGETTYTSNDFWVDGYPHILNKRKYKSPERQVWNADWCQEWEKQEIIECGFRHFQIAHTLYSWKGKVWGSNQWTVSPCRPSPLTCEWPYPTVAWSFWEHCAESLIILYYVLSSPWIYH